MMDSGIMARIREALEGGMSAQELIDEGYKSGSVFKVQWQMRQRARLDLCEPLPNISNSRTNEHPLPLGPGIGASEISNGNEGNVPYSGKDVEELQEVSSESDILRAQLYEAQRTISTLEIRLDEMIGKGQSLESERDVFEQKVLNLESKLMDAFPTCPNCGQGRTSHYWCGYQWNCPVLAPHKTHRKNRSCNLLV